jgi:hypothetical protein
MKHILVSILMIAVGSFGLINADKLQQLYAETVEETVAAALDTDVCANIGSNLAKLTPAQRESCYAQARRGPTPVRVSNPVQR